MLSWRAAFRYPMQEAGSARQLGHAGLWLLCTPVGWLMALGYRAEVAWRLVDGQRPLLPEWRGLRLLALAHGVKALGVILAYFTPFLALYWALGLGGIGPVAEHWREVTLFFLVLPCLLPVAMPGLLLAYPAWCPWMVFSPAGVAVLAVAFAGTAFLLPAAFLQVSVYRRFRAALRVDRVVRLVAAAPGAYLEAWAIALAATAAAGLSGPLLPWGIVWSYLVIGFAFNNALAISGLPGVAERFARSELLHPCGGVAPTQPLVRHGIADGNA